MIPLLSLASGAAAAVLAVPGEYPDLPAAVAAAADGDTIELAAGDYATGALAAPIGIALTVTGASSATTTIELGAASLAVAGAGSLTLAHLTVTGNGTVRVLEATGTAALSLDDVVLTDGLTAGDGGLAWLRDHATITAVGSTFSGGRAAHGGAVALHADAVGAFDGCSFEGNVVSGPDSDGGAVRVYERSQASFTACAFTANQSTVQTGGAISSNGATTGITVDGSSFVGNTAAQAGGAIEVWGGGRLTVTGASELRSSSAGDGGAIGCAGGPCAITIDGAVQFADNVANRGGHVFVDGGSADITGATFTNGWSSAEGGAIWVGGAASGLVLTDVTFDDNHAETDGGALFLGGAALDATRATFCANGSSEAGAAIYANGVAAFAMTNAAFVANVGANEGAVRIRDRNATITQSTFVDDVSGTGEGSAAALESDDEELRFVNTAFVRGSDPALHAVGGAAILAAYAAFWEVPAGTVADTDRVALGRPPLAPLAAACAVPVPEYGGELVNAGDPALVDPDGSRSDVGATGGLDADPALWADVDADGFAAMWDCDDADPDVHPGAVELGGDGVDDDCDGALGAGVDGPGGGLGDGPNAASDRTPGATPTIGAVGCGCGSGVPPSAPWGIVCAVAGWICAHRRNAGRSGDQTEGSMGYGA